MPIFEDRGVSFPQIGALRKGAPKSKEGYVGRDLTYFRATFEPGEEKTAALFQEKYGAEPREINVLFLFEHPDDVWSEWLERLAYMLVKTGSWNDCRNLAEGLYGFYETNGTLKGVPFVLRRRPRMVSCPREGGKRVREEKWLLSIEAHPDWVEAKIRALKMEAMPTLEVGTVEQLPPGVLEEENGEVVEAEEELVEVKPMVEEPAPEKKPKRKVGGNGKQAVVRTGRWGEVLQRIGAATTYFNDGEGANPNPFHVLGAAGKCGYDAVTDENLEEVIAAVLDYARYAETAEEE